jgi:hypothetical protein
MTGALAGVADKFLLGETNMQRSLAFAGATATGFFLADVIAMYAIGKNEFKGIEQAGLEVLGGTALTMLADKFVFEPNVIRRDQLPRVATIVGADVLSTYIRDVMTSSL